MEWDHTWRGGSGLRKDAACVIGYRAPQGVPFRPDNGDSWVLSQYGDALYIHIRKEGWITDVWASPSGEAIAVDADGFVYRGRGGSQDAWTHVQLRGVLTGVWGLDDQHVYVWGEVAGSVPVFFGWDGAAWQELPAPAAPIVELHGIAPDLLVGVGDNGFVTRWDGARWHPVQGSDGTNLSTVFVASPDEVYAAGHGGTLLGGSVRGLSPFLNAGRPIPAVAKWHDRVWVATYGDLGLCSLDGGALTSVKPNLQVGDLDARGALVFTTNAKLGDTADGAAWSSYQIGTFATAAANFDAQSSA